MNYKRKKRLMAIASILLGMTIAVVLVVYALQQNINLFYTTTQIANGEAPKNHLIRVGGLVVSGSVKRSTGLQVEFALTDTEKQITVTYKGILPDLFREGQGIVALGRLQHDGIIVATEVLAKHDENYMPPEVADSLERVKKTGGQKPLAPHDTSASNASANGVSANGAHE